MSLHASGIALNVNGVPLLNGVSIQLAPGEVTAVMGPNGAGKTSLLRVLCGDLRATAGELTLNGRDFSGWPAIERARHLAVLPQHAILNFPFTAREVVMLGRIPHATGSRRDRQIVDAALRAVDVEDLADREYTRLSGGEKQRVHLARVLSQIWEAPAGGARFLLLDEPTSSLDLAHQQLMLDVVARLRAEGVAILIVLHDLNLAARCADQMLLLQCGKVACTGTPVEVLTPETVRAVFNVDASIGNRPGSTIPLVIT